MNHGENNRQGLFAVSGESLDQGYLNLRVAQDGMGAELREHCEALWENFSPYADKDFIPAFARDLDQRYWEMYLGCTLLDLGLPIEVRIGEAGPDLCVPYDNRKIWFEAIAPDQGKPGTADRVPDLMPANAEAGEIFVAQDVPKDKLLLRLTHAVWTKKKQFDRYVGMGIVSPDDVQVIAISGARLSRWGDAALPLIVSAVYPFGDMTVSFPVDGVGKTTTGFTYQPDVQKASGEGIPKTAFMEEEFSNVSAVVYDGRGLGAVRGRFGCEFVTVHNKIATVPLPPGLLRRGTEFTASEHELTRTNWEE